MSTFTIKLFATLRERAHTAELTREFPDGTTVGDIWKHLVVEFPDLGGHRDSVGFAVNQEYVEAGFKPRMGDEIAFIPPVSGGAETPAIRRQDHYRTQSASMSPHSSAKLPTLQPAQSCRSPAQLAATTQAASCFASSTRPTNRWRCPKCASSP